MLAEEATWIANVIASIREDTVIETVVDLGSSTERFRRLDQPYIDYLIFRPLRRSGIRVIHVDAREADGVDVVADITNPKLTLAGVVPEADLVLCTNLLEHVENRGHTLRNALDLVTSHGHLIVTVPCRYPYHADPIDTMYRPAPADLANDVSRMDGVEVLRADLIHADCAGAQFPSTRASRIMRRLFRQATPPRCSVSGVVARARR